MGVSLATRSHQVRLHTRSSLASARCLSQWVASMDAGLRAFATLSVVLLMHPSSAIAQDGRSEASTTAFALRTSVKASALVFRTPEWPELFPERAGAESMWRLRVEPEVRSGQSVVFALAYEQ